MINEELARLAFPGSGRRRPALRAPAKAGRGRARTLRSWKEVIGVVANVSPASPGAAPNPQFYLPVEQVPEVA